jgi:serine phosphatase RsbU (regulator of sigma subunit)
MGRLLVRDALGERTIPLDQTPFLIGRAPSSTLQVSGSEVSRAHAEISIEDGVCILRDMGSRYGTYVNGEQIDERRLTSEDVIRLGREGGIQLVFQAADEASPGDHARTDGSVEDLRHVAALLEGLRALGSGRVLDEVLALVLDSAVEITGAERGFVMLANDSGELEFTLARARGRITLTGGTFATSRMIPEQVFRTGVTQVIGDLLDGDMATTHMGDVALGIRHVVCAPLNVVKYVDTADARGDDRRIGVLYLDSRERGQLLSASTRAAIETLAAEASVAIANARLYRETLVKQRLEQEMRIAAEVQQALLPSPRLTPNFVEAAAASVPCRSIGADFFDYSKEQSDLFSFTVGDVAGKGAPAAFMSALMQGMSGLFVQDSEEPAIAVASMNKALCLRALESRFVSLVYGVLSQGGELTYCNAGYNSPLVIGPTGTRRLNTGGPIVGLFESANYEQETIQLEKGDMVVVWSDGVSEAQDAAGGEFGDRRVQDVVEREGTTGSADTLVHQVIANVKGFIQGAVLNDDITVMVVRYRGPRT